ncbi:MAG TPA: hypothetical protein VH257_17250, partial [Chloroflexota bacterium]|nr:hypothetical protein [Chloroflexota bacterium]
GGAVARWRGGAVARWRGGAVAVQERRSAPLGAGLQYADLELSLRAVDAGADQGGAAGVRAAELGTGEGGASGRFAAELRLLLPGGAAEARLLGAPPPVVRLDPGPLLGLRADPAAYGAQLSERLFADPRLREGVARARAAAAGSGAALRLRLRLDPAAALLHGLAWETLQDPDGGGFLFTSERVLLSRYLDAADLTPPAPRRAGALRVVLWRTGALPLDCVPFLDYGVKRVLLRRVGGGYMFVHRLLQEHFATAGAPGEAGDEGP